MVFALYLLAIIESLLVFQEIKRQAASYISKKSSDFLKCLKVNCEILCDRRQPGLTAKFKRERERWEEGWESLSSHQATCCY